MVRGFQERILDWYELNKRDLPWRKTTDPYEILVSEVMLQQTQVDRVIPKYLAFLEAFPTPWHLASASAGQVIALWSGLGYNRRAVYLYRAAKKIVEKEGFPSDDVGLMALPGVGLYTARAVQSFAFGKDVSVVDTNIRRIFSRVFFLGEGRLKQIDEQVAAAVPKGRGRTWNNALMDFGSLICSASNPKCGSCPIRDHCTALRAGTQQQFVRIAPPQKQFVGSRRQYRGMVLNELKDGARTIQAITRKLGKDRTFTISILDELERDGLVKVARTRVRLP